MKTKAKFLLLFAATLLLVLPSCKKESTPTTQSVPFNCTLYSSITTNTTLPAGIDTVTCNIEVSNNATLTILPGTTLIFGQGNQVQVDQGASISAIGTSSNPIVFEGLQSTAGYWNGIFIRSISVTNQFTYCTIRGAGANTGNNTFGADVSIYQGTAGFTNCTVTNSKDAGIYFYGIYSQAPYVDQAVFNTFTNNTVSGCGSYPIATFAAGAGSIGTGNTFTGSSNNSIAVQAEDASHVSVNVTLSALSVPYDFIQLTGDAGDVFDKTFTILPGATILMGSGISLVASPIGTFVANGTSANPITIKGEQATAGWWGSLTVQSPNAYSFTYCNVSGGGGAASYSSGAGQNGLIGTYMYVPTARNITVQYCTLSNSGSAGIYVSPDAPALAPTYNTSTITSSNTFSNCNPNVQTM